MRRSFFAGELSPAAIVDYATGTLKGYIVWRVVLGLGALMGLYHFIAHAMGTHVYGASNFLNAIGPKIFARMLKGAELAERFDVETEADFKSGRMVRKQKLAPVDPKPDELV